MSDDENEDYVGALEILEAKYQTLLQTFIERRIIEQKTVDNIVACINRHYGDREASSEYIRSINSTIISLNLQIKDLRTSDKHFWCLVNLKPDESSKLTTNYNANETTLFKLTVCLFINNHQNDLIMETLIANGGEAKSSECINLANRAAISLSMAEMTLQKFKVDGWLKDSGTTMISLTERAILDLNPILTELPHCQLCKQIVLPVNGVVEECMNCQIRLHPHCSNQYFKKTANCPACKQRFK
ncbi:hypothetical protein PPL_07911 [Heterostelium album PN500]|uniref:Non-structural maintenance of chromosomes element 1 homolog n=1 Tax=Heterostelium pallidum (strain ATCC 26659 / Pp 5 / PN500) TaxID=670386 RepID=D3BHA9_HETP5|nr:hypothetical protein PPL_07911 [Heterostelium album PN500]EFA79086.1 hypothetical protein PPL_07911 [Heterostelium album PN500]|eukprot:XP_020431208.1 hypothetical protein PPL_07911 [Heterostelium album PN500]